MEFIRDQSPSTYAPGGEEASRVGGPTVGEREDPREGDHGPANSAYGEKMQSMNMEDGRAVTPAADTIQQAACATVKGVYGDPARRKVGRSEMAPPRWRPQEGRDVIDAATTGSRKLELGFHQEERGVTTVKGWGGYIDASKEVNDAGWRRRRSHSQVVHSFRLRSPKP
jgi:hypothetical protein